MEIIDRYFTCRQSASAMLCKVSYCSPCVCCLINREDCPSDDEMIARLSAMGFSVEMVAQALALEQGDVDSALNLLLTSPERCVECVGAHLLYLHVHRLASPVDWSTCGVLGA